MTEMVRTKELEEKLKVAKSLEEAAQILASEGIQVSVEELEAMLAQPDDNGELNERALENVSGGAVWIWGVIIRTLRPISPSRPVRIWPWRKNPF